MIKRKRINDHLYKKLYCQVCDQLDSELKYRLHYQLDLPLRNQLTKITEDLEMVVVL